MTANASNALAPAASPAALRLRFAKVTFFAGLVLLIETVLFHLLMYVHEFYTAMSVISFAVLGIGLGAFYASQVRAGQTTLFASCCIGTATGLYLVSYVLVSYPLVWAIAVGTALTVFFPVVYISVLFRDHPGGKIYCYDMAGAFAGVAVTVLLYRMFSSEAIVLLLLTLLPALALIELAVAGLRGRANAGSGVAAGLLLSAAATVLGAVLLTLQLSQDRFNVYRIFDRDAPYQLRKVLKTNGPEQLVASYDSLIERIDILKSRDGKLYYVCYNGYANDHFRPGEHRTYEYYRERGRRWPTSDKRVFYGMVDEPEIYIIGAAARGITHTVKKITPPENIFAVEIDPSIVQIMSEDFYEQSGYAYRGLEPVVGNAISLLKTLDREFDIITMINTHSGRTIGYRSGPDHLHTLENYGLYFDHLSEDGYILFEERPYNRSGELGFYRMLNTVWHALKRRGAEDPSRHFLIWEWDVAKDSFPRIDRRYDHKRDRYRHAEKIYVGMIVTKNPIAGERLENALAWLRDGVSIVRVNYLKDLLSYGETADVMAMIENRDFGPLAAEGFDAGLVTNDRPFPSLSTASVPQLDRLLGANVAVFLILTAAFALAALRGANKSQRKLALLGAYNIAIGLGYFLIEIMLLQAYQNIFVSPSWALVLVLGFLLLSSGVGGLLCGRLPIWLATALLIPCSVAAVYLPPLLAASAMPEALTKGLCIGLVCLNGLLMGAYFPKGLLLADRWRLRDKIPHLFAINSVAGSFAVILALYLGAKVGYQSTVLIAILCYSVAGLLLPAARAQTNADTDVDATTTTNANTVRPA